MDAKGGKRGKGGQKKDKRREKQNRKESDVESKKKGETKENHHTATGKNVKQENEKEIVETSLTNSTKTDVEDKHEDLEDGRFSKRKIESNWHRYEDKEDEDDVKMRGVDFTSALEMAGGSFFRFQDEKEWEVDAKNQANEFLLLDCKDLGEAMNCISLPKRLLISSDIFPPKLLRKYESAAKENASRYQTKGKNRASFSFGDIGEKSSTKVDMASRKSLQFTSQSEFNVCTDIKADATKEKILEPQENATFISDSTKAAVIKDSYPSTLDSTTIMNQNETVAKSIQKKSANKALTVKADLEEDADLDELLSMKSTSVSSTTSNGNDNDKEVADIEVVAAQPKIDLFPAAKVSEKEPNLEDWLTEFLEE